MNHKNPITLFFCLLSFYALNGQTLPEPLAHFEFWPKYTLPGNAAQYPGNYSPPPQSRFEAFQARQNGFLFNNRKPTESIQNLMEKEWPASVFSIEMLVLHHVNKTISSALYLLDPKNSKPNFLLTYHNENKRKASISCSLNEKTIRVEASPIFKYWYHLVAIVEDEKLQLFVNGEPQGEVEGAKLSSKVQLDLAAYLDEPYMQLSNMVKEVKVYNQALNQDQVNSSLLLAKEKIKKGQHFSGLFHFNAGPYLHLTTPNAVNLLWETNMPATAVIEYGPQLPLTEKLMVEEINPSETGYDAFIQEATIGGLKPHTKYFYNIKLRSIDGFEMESGVFSFQTAVTPNETFQFAAIGDTETRPHVNDRIAKLIWGERPDFVIHMGDLTDGGSKNAKWQWNYEYFHGMTQLHTRIPVFPVPGNGEGKQLYWYKKYHRLGEEEAFYKFQYGNADFFMLNSNNRKEEFKEGGRQYKWLDEQLAASKSKWQFVCMHHAPYSTDENDYGDSYKGMEEYGDKNVKQLIPLFEKHQVDIVFFGHLHSYSRMGPILNEKIENSKGVWYIQTGGAGGNLEDFGPTRAWFSEKVYAGHHYCMININQGHLTFKMYDTEGRLRDFMEIEKASNKKKR